MRYRQPGLTLVELLVAISVLAFVAVLGWRGLDSITRARASLNTDLEQTRGLQLAFAQMQSDCANAVDAGTLDGRSPLVIDAMRVTIARRVQPEGKAGALQLVTWRLRDGVLTREESPPTRDLTQLAQYAQFAQTGGAQAVKLQTAKLLELQRAGCDPNDVILQSIERGWSGLFAVKAQPPPGVVSLRDKRVANMAELTGQARHERTVEGVAERVGGAAVPALPGDLRQSHDDDVGRRPDGRGQERVG